MHSEFGNLIYGTLPNWCVGVLRWLRVNESVLSILLWVGVISIEIQVNPFMTPICHCGNERGGEEVEGTLLGLVRWQQGHKSMASYFNTVPPEVSLEIRELEIRVREERKPLPDLEFLEDLDVWARNP